MKRITIFLSLCIASFATAMAQNVSNVTTSQSGSDIIISYDLDKEADIHISYSIDGGRNYTQLQKVDGDIGMNVSKGRKHATWHVTAETESFHHNDVRFMVTAEESYANYTKRIEDQEKAYKKEQRKLAAASAYTNYIHAHDKYEVILGEVKLGLLTCVDFSLNLFALRLGPVEIDWAQVGVTRQFVGDVYTSLQYCPEIKGLIPWSDNFAVVLGIGPTINWDSYNNEFNIGSDVRAHVMAEVGVMHHWGTLGFSEYFLRYNNYGVSIGASFGLGL